jgi:hypothetical protein
MAAVLASVVQISGLRSSLSAADEGVMEGDEEGEAELGRWPKGHSMHYYFRRLGEHGLIELLGRVSDGKVHETRSPLPIFVSSL